MNKFFLYIIIILSFSPVFAQSLESIDSVVVHQEITAIPDTSAVTPLQFKENFKEQYSGGDFQYESAIKDTSAWDKFKAWLNYWLGRIFSFGIDDSNASAFEIVLKVLAILIVLFVVYMIVKTFINGEGTWIFGKSSKKKIATSDITEEDIHNIDFEKMIREAKSKANYRFAIRYYYLWLLKRMSDNTVIEWDIEKTNSDYLYEIKDASLRKDFAYLSYIYDYSWYGEFELNETAFGRSEKAFLTTINTL